MQVWHIQRKKTDFKEIASQFNIDQVTARLLWNRDIPLDKIEKFLYGDMSHFHDESLLKDMALAKRILFDAINRNDKIRIVGDYDVDGICATTILFKALTMLEANVDWDIPNRIIDGYGINRAIVKRAYDEGVKVIITCDNGISACDAISYAKELGMMVVITDHHELPEVLPKADAIINPKQPDCHYPCDMLCGAGVAYKLSLALLKERGIEKEATFVLLEYVALATVADMVPLVDENRLLVQIGLKYLKKTNQVGLKMLLNELEIKQENLQSYHIGFMIGPTLNAGGRLDTAKKCVELLLENNEVEARVLSEELVELNKTRKQMTEVMTYEGVNKAREYEEDRVLVIYLPECHESIAGIVAGRIKEEFYKPTIVLTNGEKGIKGSARSIEAYDMFKALSELSEYFLAFGGHPMAAGMTLKTKDVDAFRREINNKCRLTQEDMVEHIYIDMAMPLRYVDESLLREFDLLEPFGIGNPKPTFGESGAKVISAKVFGNDRRVLKLSLRSRENFVYQAVMFQHIDEFFDEMRREFGDAEVAKAKRGEANTLYVTCIYFPVLNEYRNQKTFQMQVRAIKASKNTETP